MLSPTHQCLSHTRNLILFKVNALSFSLILGKEITQQTKLVLIHLWHLSPVTFWMSVAIKSKLICKHTTVVDFCPRSHAAEWPFHVTRLENPLTRLCYAPHPPLYMELRKLAALDQLLQEAVVLCETFFGTGHWMFKPLKSALSQNVQNTLYIQPPWHHPCPCLLQSLSYTNVSNALEPPIEMLDICTYNTYISADPKHFEIRFAKIVTKLWLSNWEKKQPLKSGNPRWFFVGGNSQNALLLSAETTRKMCCCYLQKQRVNLPVSSARSLHSRTAKLPACIVTAWYTSPAIRCTP